MEHPEFLGRRVIIPLPVRAMQKQGKHRRRGIEVGDPMLCCAISVAAHSVYVQELGMKDRTRFPQFAISIISIGMTDMRWHWNARNF